MPLTFCQACDDYLQATVVRPKIKLSCFFDFSVPVHWFVPTPTKSVVSYEVTLVLRISPYFLSVSFEISTVFREPPR